MDDSVFRHDHWTQTDEGAADRQTASLAAVVVVLLLLIGGLFLVHELRATAVLEDCLMAGRRDCDRMVTPGR